AFSLGMLNGNLREVDYDWFQAHVHDIDYQGEGITDEEFSKCSCDCSASGAAGIDGRTARDARGCSRGAHIA
ncbi:MAG: hypothetical protein KDI55_08765, partial [Anaerolineae bacterium]|nr:hypothetical protein [Anaerolineae bacterium]